MFHGKMHEEDDDELPHFEADDDEEGAEHPHGDVVEEVEEVVIDEEPGEGGDLEEKPAAPARKPAPAAKAKATAPKAKLAKKPAAKKKKKSAPKKKVAAKKAKPKKVAKRKKR